MRRCSRTRRGGPCSRTARPNPATPRAMSSQNGAARCTGRRRCPPIASVRRCCAAARRWSADSVRREISGAPAACRLTWNRRPDASGVRYGTGRRRIDQVVVRDVEHAMPRAGERAAGQVLRALRAEMPVDHRPDEHASGRSGIRRRQRQARSRGMFGRSCLTNAPDLSIGRRWRRPDRHARRVWPAVRRSWWRRTPGVLPR